MNRETRVRLLGIACAMLAAAGLLFLSLALFAPDGQREMLAPAFGCFVLAALFWVIRAQNRRQP